MRPILFIFSLLLAALALGASEAQAYQLASYRFYNGPTIRYYNAGGTTLTAPLFYLRKQVNASSLNMRLVAVSSTANADIIIRRSKIYSCNSNTTAGVGGPGKVVIGADCTGQRAMLVLAHEMGHALGLRHEDRRCAMMNSKFHRLANNQGKPAMCTTARNWYLTPYLSDDIYGLRRYWVNTTPVANFTLTLNETYGENYYTFLDTSVDKERNIIRRTIDFGDGSETKTHFDLSRWTSWPNWAVGHRYQKPGIYNVTMTVYDSYGKTSRKQVSVTVTV